MFWDVTEVSQSVLCIIGFCNKVPDLVNCSQSWTEKPFDKNAVSALPEQLHYSECVHLYTSFVTIDKTTKSSMTILCRNASLLLNYAIELLFGSLGCGCRNSRLCILTHNVRFRAQANTYEWP